MITLYGFPMSCSLAVHIALRMIGTPYEISWVSYPSCTLADGSSYTAVNPRRQVPALKTAAGAILTETPAILQYLADQFPGASLAPPNGTFERARLQEALNYFATEVHKQVLWQFSNITQFPWPLDQHREILMGLLVTRLDFIASRLGQQIYYLGDSFTLADAYLAVIFYWATRAGADLTKWPTLQSYRERLHAVPQVAECVAVDLAEQARILSAGGRA